MVESSFKLLENVIPLSLGDSVLNNFDVLEMPFGIEESD